MVVACGTKAVETNIEQKIVDTINQNTYNKQIDFSTKADFLKSKITVDFIKNSIGNELLKNFQDNLFTFDKVKIVNQEDINLSDKDLEETGKIETKIKYNYGEFQNQTTNLIIEIKDKEEYQLNDGAINTLIKATDGNIYAATSNANIWKINNKQKKHEKMEIKIDNDQSFNETISFLLEATNGKLYAGTTSNRVWEISLKDNFAVLKIDISAKNNYITTLVELTNGEIYTGTGMGNIFEIPLIKDKKTKNFIIERDFSAVTALVETVNDNIYASTSGGNIWKLNLKTQEYNKVESFENEIIFDMKQINDSQFILATQNKIYQYNLDDKKITERFTLDDSKDSFLLIKNTKKEFYVTTKLGKLYQMDLKNNQLINIVDIKEEIISLLLTNNSIYLGTKTNVRELMSVS